MKVTGTVAKIFDKTHKGRTFYSVCITPESGGDDIWVGTGLDKPSFSEGTTVSVEANKEGNFWKAKAGDFEVTKAAAPAAKRGGGGGGWNDPDRQASIVAQSSYDKAIALVTVALANDALTLGTAKKDKWENLLNYVKEAAREVAADVAALSQQIVDGDLEVAEKEEDDFVPLPE